MKADVGEGKRLQGFCLCSILLLGAAGICWGFAEGGIKTLLGGIWKIIISRDALITDYFELAGYGAAFFNAALVTGIGFLLLTWEKVKFTGLTLAAFFINAGYALWGKNPVNILPVLLGTFLYAKLHKAKLGRYIYTALFGTSLAPFMTELVYLLPFSKEVNLLLSFGAGLFIGFILPPLSMHTASMHMGYSLYNVGFSAGIVAFVLMCVMESFGMESSTVLIWKEGRNPFVLGGLLLYFGGTFLYGLYCSQWKIKRLFAVWRHPGRAVADFVLMDGVGPTLMNMGTIGLLCVGYIWLIGGDFSGPVVGAILTAFGFSAFGGHLKNYWSVLLGVFLSTFLTKFQAVTPGIQLAAVFAVGLAPIAGQFGPIAGVVAGMLHAVIVMCTAEMYGGLNLYNNGFSTGWVAIVMIPILESFMTRFPQRKRKPKGEVQHDS